MFKRFTRRATTLDREATEVHIAQKLGRSQALTPEGFLLCTGVPIKRLGTMMYGPGEVPIKPGKDGVAYVTRDAKALFADVAINSYQGKAVVNEHPEEDVTPRNWKRLAIGTVLNPRRGEGDDSDVMIADLLITDAMAIKDVMAGKREVSAGYEADYEQTGEGAGRQTNIIGNHVALVTRGRCGPRCSIGDSDPNPSTLKGTETMAHKNARPRVKLTAELVRTAFKDAGDNLAEQLAGEVGPEDGDDETDGDGATHIHIHAGGGGEGSPAAPADANGADPGAPASMEDRVAALEQAIQAIMAKLNPPAAAEPPPAAAAEGGEGGGEGFPSKDEGPDDLTDGQGGTKPDGKTNDSAALATSFQKTVSDAEILVPGFKVPTFDAALPRAKTVDNICQLRRKVLGHMGLTKDGASLLASVSDAGDVKLDGMSCAQIGPLFTAAAAAKRAINNRAATGDGKMGASLNMNAARPPTPADINKANADFWRGR